jgi:amino acid transporter
MFVGFDVIPQSAEEIDLPFAAIGRLLVVSILLAILWYALVIGAVAMALPASERAISALPTADAAAALFSGSWAGKLLVIGGIAGILTSWNAFLIGGSRALYALAKAGQVPSTFAGLALPLPYSPSRRSAGWRTGGLCATFRQARHGLAR